MDDSRPRRRMYNNDHKDYDNNRGGGGGSSSSSSSSKTDDPPNSRLFIVCGKQITEEEFREAFGPYGEIEEVWVLKDRVTGEPKGVTYIKFAKTSEAALAMEEMNGRCIASSPRPLKVMIAHSRDQGSRRETNEEERLLRLFVVVPKSTTEAELKEHFSRFGDIDYVSIVRDRNTKESKGFAYVKYHRMSHSAKAFEGCDRSYKPVFADPKPQKYNEENNGSKNHHSKESQQRNYPGSTTSNSSSSVSAYDMLSYMDSSQSNPEGISRLTVSVSPTVNQDQLWRLFDLIPGLDYCDWDRSNGSSSRHNNNNNGNKKGHFCVVYNNPQSATYAKEKLHGFEYPPGCRMVVKFDFGYDRQQQQQQPSYHHHQGGGFGMAPPPPPAQQPPPPPQQSRMIRQPPAAVPPANIQTDLAHLTETIANATALLQAAGYTATPPNAPANNPPPPASALPSSSSSSDSSTYDPSYCSVKLPGPQPLATMDSPVAERLFIVCTPTPPHLYALKDVFGRFGNLIDIYMLNGKTCGYAKYANKESADRAVSALHGQEICGSRLKVMPADPQDKSGGDPGRKRPKIAAEGDQ